MTFRLQLVLPPLPVGPVWFEDLCYKIWWCIWHWNKELCCYGLCINTYLVSIGCSEVSPSQLKVPPVTETALSLSMSKGIHKTKTYTCIWLFHPPIFICVPEEGLSYLSTEFGSSSSALRNLCSRVIDTLTCTTLDMRVGSMLRGLRRRLKRERATNALSAVRCWSVLMNE